MITIAVTNEQRELSDDQVTAMVTACQVQDDRDLRPAWQLPPAQLVFVPHGQTPPVGAWRARMLETSDVAGALGYHTDEGLPETYVFVRTTLAARLSPSVTLSHELCEMRVDPTTHLVDRHGLAVFAREVCDPCEADELGYLINGVLVSDFVTPAWFKARAKAPYDFLRHIAKPYTLAPGGYALEWNHAQGWHQVFADAHGATRPGTSGRSRLRMIGVCG